MANISVRGFKWIVVTKGGEKFVDMVMPDLPIYYGTVEFSEKDLVAMLHALRGRPADGT